MPKDILNIFVKKIKNVFKNKIFLDHNEIKYIEHNKKFWKNRQTEANKIILVDLFHWYPLIHFWTYLTNILALKKKAKIKYFYFRTIKNKFTNHNLFINKLSSIYKSFNVEKGLTSNDFNYTKKELKIFSKNFEKLHKKKNKLNQYSVDGIKIGDLIYDSYLFYTRNSTVNFDDPLLKEIFVEANKIFFLSKKYFKENKVVALIPSHVCYIPYGIITRIALNKNINVYKIKCENWANAFFRLIKIDKKSKIDEQPFYDYQKKFNSFKIKEKKLARKVGEKILNKRISGRFDKNLPYMKISQFKNDNSRFDLIKNNKPKIVIFSHCFYDNPHRFRKMYFNDFFEQIDFILNLSLKMKNYEWFYKPHPNELDGNLDIHNYFKKKYSHIRLLQKNTSHRKIIRMKPKFVISNHGTIAHEYASFRIPVINTGDNPHINYNFCLHAKSKNELKKILFNFDLYKKKIKFNKNKIYEFLYMHYEYYPNLYDKKKLINDKYFAKKNVADNQKSSILKYFIKRHTSDNKNLSEYINNFINKN